MWKGETSMLVHNSGELSIFIYVSYSPQIYCIKSSATQSSLHLLKELCRNYVSVFSFFKSAVFAVNYELVIMCNSEFQWMTMSPRVKSLQSEMVIFITVRR